MKTITVQISGMHCDHCVRSIREALSRTHGVREADVHIGDATITFDESVTTKGTLLSAIRGAGDFDVAGFAMEDAEA